MKTVNYNIRWFKKQGGLSEIYQQVGMLFSFVSPWKDGIFEICHKWVKCRDFLQDVIRTQITGKSLKIYGFEFNTTDYPQTDLDAIRLVVTMDNLSSKEKIESLEEDMLSSLKLLNYFEKTAKLPLTTLEKVNPEGSDKDAVYMFTGPAFWIQAPFMISMYTLLIRLGAKRFDFNSKEELDTQVSKLINQTEINDNDTKYLRIVWPYIYKVFNYKKILFNNKDGFHALYNNPCNINAFHERSGIISLVKAITPDEELNKVVKEFLIND